ncbi:MAG: hypothetical protein M3256_13405, partial [Actinomycetota bacterium]|nr:hypothetical protein [Actinomycetota bacterium]
PLAMPEAVRSLPLQRSAVPLGLALLRASPDSQSAAGRRQTLDPPQPPPDRSAAIWSLLDARAARGAPPATALAVMLAVSVVAGSMAYLVLRRRGASSHVWPGVAVVGLVVALVTGAAHHAWPGAWLEDDEVRIDRIAGGRALTEEYHHLSAVRGGEVELGLSQAAVWIGTPPPGPRALPDALAEIAGRGAVPGPGTVEGGDHADARVQSRARGDTRLLRVLRHDDADVALEAHLRLTGGRLTGTVANGGRAPLRALQARLPGG